MLSYRFTLSFGPSSAPFGCLPLAGLFALLGPWVFLRQLPSSSFASLRSTPLRSLVKMVLFFVALAMAIPIGELQALSRDGHPNWRASGTFPLFFIRPR